MPRNQSPPPINAGYLADLSTRIERKLTVPDQVAQALRDLILCGELAPGAAVVESLLARQLRVGQPTVREALKTLEVEGLIERHPNRGCTVMKLDRADFEQVYFLRRQWEPMAVELAMANFTQEKSARLQAAFDVMDQAANAGDTRGYFAADLAFHRTIWSLSGNRFLEKALQNIALPMFAFFVTEAGRQELFDIKENMNEHRTILRHMIDGDAQASVAAMRASLSNFGKVVDRVIAGP